MSVRNGQEWPQGWCWTCLEDVSTLISGNPAPQGMKNFDAGGAPFVRVQDMGRLGSQVRLTDTKDHLAKSVTQSLQLFPAGAVLFTKSGASTLLNQRAILHQPMYVVSHIAAALPEDGVLSEWLYFWLSTIDFAHYAHATTLPSLPLSKAKKIKIPIASTAEQARITETLDELFSNLDAGIAALSQARAKLKRYRASVLKAAVEGTLTADWRAAHPNIEPASKLLKRILAERRRHWEEEQLRKFEDKGVKRPKNWQARYKAPAAPITTDMSPLPETWSWATMDQLTSKLMNGFGKRSQAEGSPCIVLRLADVFEGEISYKNVRRINCTDDQVRKYGVNENDLLILRVNGSADLVGRFVLFKSSHKKILFCDHFIRAQCISADTAAWLRIYADGDRFRGHVDHNKVSSAGQNTINQSTLLPFSVPLPPIAEQKVIAETIEDHYSVIDHLKAELDAKMSAVQGLRQSILCSAFSGKLVPQDTKDEPASELLKRIAAERKAVSRAAADTKRAVRRAGGGTRRRRHPRKRKTAGRV